jgi:hypothetical protein
LDGDFHPVVNREPDEQAVLIILACIYCMMRNPTSKGTKFINRESDKIVVSRQLIYTVAGLTKFSNI